MIHVRTANDLATVQQSSSLSDDLILEAERYFNALREACPPDCPGIESALGGGYVVVIEPGDAEDAIAGVLGTSPEYAEIVQTGAQSVLRIVCMHDHAILVFMTVLGIHPHLDAWVAPYLESDS